MMGKEKLEYLDTKSAKIIEKLYSENCTFEHEVQILKEAVLFDANYVQDDSLIRACLSIIINQSYKEGENNGIKRKEEEIKELLYKKHIG